MNWSVLRILYVHELRMLVRTRRMVVMAIVLPAIIMPAILFASRYSQGRRERSLDETTYRYAVTGPLRERVRTLIADTRKALLQSSREDFEDLRRFTIQEVQAGNAAEMLVNEALHFYVKTAPAVEAGASSGIPVLTVVYRGNNDPSQNGGALMQRLLRLAQPMDSERMLRGRGFPVASGDVIKLEVISTATASQVTGSGIGRFLTLILVMLMFTGGSIAAMDIIAGEKERGTLETLLTTAARRHEIVTAKQLSITSVALVITLIQALNFFLYVRLEVIPLPSNFALQIPTATIFTLLLLYLPLALAIAAILLTISAYAKTYKEAQLYFFPVYLIGIFPALAAILPGVSLRSVIVFVPIANVSVAVREILTGRSDPLMIAITIAVMTMTAGALMRRSARMLSREDIVSPDHLEFSGITTGPERFQKQVLRWFAVMWAVIFVVASSMPQLATFRRQVLFNELIVFLGASVLMIKIYGLNIKETLALRPVKPVVWVAVLIAIPCGGITAQGVFRILNMFIPVSQRLIEELDVFPDGISQWQIYMFASVIPAVCEEIGFRGLLLHGLRKRFRPEVLPVAAGLIFGMFHFTLFRIAPTAFLGMVITGITLLTGSIFPGMLLHFGNNALGVWAGNNAFSLDALKWWQYLGPIAIFGLALYIIYRNRTPYPDMRSL